MNVKIVFDSVDIIDGIKDSFSVHVSMEEDVFSARVVNLEPSPEMLNGKADAIINTASGEIASFPDGADGVPMKSLVVSMQPIQNLNGYSQPWPAGGGKNKYDVSKMVNTSDITINNGVISVTGNAKNSTKKLSELADLAVGETYILTANTTGTENIIYLYGTGANVIWTFGTSKTITQKMLDALVFFYGGQDMTSQISNFMVRLSSVTDATFAPYENICPISGRTGLSVYVSPTQDQQDATTHAVDWTSEAGTVYGGTDEVVTGGLASKYAIVTFDGTEGWTESGTSAQLSDDVFAGRKGLGNNRYIYGLSNQIETLDNGRINNNVLRTTGTSSAKPQIQNYKTAFGVDSIEGLKTYFANNPLQVCYELATPLTYQLSPQEVETLKGQNHVWSNAGDVDLTYVADTKLYIDNKIAQAIAAALNA